MRINHQSYHLSFHALVQYDSFAHYSKLKKVQPCKLYEQVYVNIDLKFILVIVLARMAAMDG